MIEDIDGIVWTKGTTHFEIDEDKLIETIDHPITEIILKAIQCNQQGKYVNLCIQAPTGTGKTVLLKQFELPENYGIKIIKNKTTANEFMNVLPTHLKNQRIHTLILEDIAWVMGMKNVPGLFDAWKQYIDGEIGSNQCESNTPIKYKVGLIITCTTDFFKRKNIVNAWNSATLETRINNVFFKYSQDCQDLIIDEMIDRKNKNSNDFEYQKIKISDYKIQKHQLDINDKFVVKSVTTSPRLASQLMNLLTVGLSPGLLKYFKNDPNLELNYDKIKGR